MIAGSQSCDLQLTALLLRNKREKWRKCSRVCVWLGVCVLRVSAWLHSSLSACLQSGGSDSLIFECFSNCSFGCHICASHCSACIHSCISSFINAIMHALNIMIIKTVIFIFQQYPITNLFPWLLHLGHTVFVCMCETMVRMPLR